MIFDEKLQAEFEIQKEAHGYGSNADFIDYLLRVSEGSEIIHEISNIELGDCFCSDNGI